MELFVDIQKKLGNFSLNIRFDAHAGITGLLGASGSGKSMTLKCIAGLERPDSGVIRLNGRTLFDSAQGIDLPPQQRQVGYLFQSYALFPHMTVEENILCGMHREKDRRARRHVVDEMCALLQLQGLEKHRPAQLSGGQAQRVALARILVTKPQLLLLDEPFSALDSYLRDTLQPQMLSLLDELGVQTLLVTHDRDEAYRMCANLRILDAGQVIRSGDTSQIFAAPGTVAAARITGCKNIAPARPAGEYEVFVPQWGITLRTEVPVPEHVTAVGLRAHTFSPLCVENQFTVEYQQILEEPFSRSALFRFSSQPPDTPPIWWQTLKDGPLPQQLGVAPADILLLT